MARKQPAKILGEKGVGIMHSLFYLRRLVQNPFTAYQRFKQIEESYQLFMIDFVKQDWIWLYDRIKPGTTVIDIGARAGDTTFYFAMHPNASKIIAYEPIPNVFKELKHNVSISPLKNKIEARNEAVSHVRTRKRLDDKRYWYGFNYENSDEDSKGTYIQSITLNDALRGLKNVAIKSNCEGAEEHFFDNADLSNVYAIRCEYKIRSRDHIVDVLKKKGFKVRYEDSGKEEWEDGHVYAWKSKP